MTDKRKITPERRKEIAQKAAAARWGNLKRPRQMLRTMQDIEAFCRTLALSGNLPYGYYDTTPHRSGDILDVAAARAMHVIQLGLEVGLQPGQAIASISIRNGIPLINGDAQLALVLHSGKAHFVTEEMHADGAVCSTHRIGDERSYGVKFSIDDAIKAGLWETPGPWTTHPLRMLKYKARAFCLRDKYPDVIKGLAHSTEEMEGEVIKARYDTDIAPHDPANKLTGIVEQRMLHNATTINKGDKTDG